MNQRTTIILVAIAAIAVGIATYWLSEPKALSNDQLEQTIILPQAKTIEFPNLIDHTGAEFDAERLQGFWNIVFFAFTNCPDICPATMQQLSEVKRVVSEQYGWGNYQVTFISVDPARDTLERIASYVPHFDKEFIGLTGKPIDIQKIAKQLGIIFVAEAPDENGNYNVDHSASIILINPQGQMAGVMSAPHTIDNMSKDLITLAKHYATDHQVILDRPHLADPVSQSERASNQTMGKQPASDDAQTELGLKITNAWSRTPPPNVSTLAGYMTLVNTSSEDISIVAVESASFDSSMIHNTTIENGMSKMNHIDALTIKAGETVALKPKGLHLMLMGADDAVLESKAFDISLLDQAGNNYPVQFQLR